MVDGRDAEGMRKILGMVESFGDGVQVERGRVLALIDEALAAWAQGTAVFGALELLRKAVTSGEERPT